MGIDILRSARGTARLATLRSPRQPAAMSAMLMGALILLSTGGSAHAAVADTATAPAIAVGATPTPENAVAGNDYANPANWLCRPDKGEGACAQSQDASVVAVTGEVTPQPFKANATPILDCFYVYPTSSEDTTANSDMQPGDEIQATAKELGRFAAQCRPFAPLYRSITRRALRAELLGFPLAGTNFELPYADVRDAWRYYLAHDNHGRGVVLIGHSQGGHILAHLIANDIEGKPVQRQFVSAILLGADVTVSPGKASGGTFKSIPLCARAEQLGCVIAYSAYRATLPPSVDPPAHFAHAANGLMAACTNPAALGTDGKVPLDPYFGVGKIRWSTRVAVVSPYVRVPKLISGQCVSRGEFRYLEITVDAAPGGARTDDIPGDLIVFGRPDPLWGLHVVDVAVALGNLVDVVGREAAAWQAAPRQM